MLKSISFSSPISEQLREYLQRIRSGTASIVRSTWIALHYILRWDAPHKEVTESYPDPVSSRMPDDLPGRSRGLLFNDIDKCSGCLACERICPAQCIDVQAETGLNSNRVWVSVFDIDFSKCIFCGLCVEACEPASLNHTKEYESAAYSAEDLVARFGKGEISQEQRLKWNELSREGEFL